VRAKTFHDLSDLPTSRPADLPAEPFAALAVELADLEARGLKRERRRLESPQGARVTVDGRDYAAFCSNDYLGLAAHPRLVEAAREGAERYGVGAGASHLIVGHASPHHALEEALAAFVGLPRALLFSTGYMANIGIVTALAGRGDAVFADRLNHASLNDAAVLSRAELRRYPHLDTAALERLLGASRARRKLVVTDAVFSMDGDVADVPALARLCERHDAWLLIDDAHGFGVLGRGGRGTLSHFGLHFDPHFDLGSPRVIYMATLGKAAGVFGAFVAGGGDLVETLIQRARAGRAAAPRACAPCEPGADRARGMAAGAPAHARRDAQAGEPPVTLEARRLRHRHPAGGDRRERGGGRGVGSAGAPGLPRSRDPAADGAAGNGAPEDFSFRRPRNRGRRAARRGAQ
jgi:7-keto-8-aminopelargonate synthetase-like enzyme